MIVLSRSKKAAHVTTLSEDRASRTCQVGCPQAGHSSTDAPGRLPGPAGVRFPGHMDAMWPVIGVVGGRGGAGASTFAAVLAAMAGLGGRAILVDLDPIAGGLDV